MDETRINELESKVAHLERHITEQDSEIYKLCRRLEQSDLKLDRLKQQLDALSQNSGGDLPANERPPHY
jgi:uncharacterized coiled-coil protein SlyX